ILAIRDHLERLLHAGDGSAVLEPVAVGGRNDDWLDGSRDKNARPLGEGSLTLAGQDAGSGAREDEIPSRHFLTHEYFPRAMSSGSLTKLISGTPADWSPKCAEFAVPADLLK